MSNFEDFRQQLQHALLHLDDPDYVISSELCQIVLCGGSSPSELAAFQSAVIETIKEMKPDPNQALGSRAEFTYQILEQRFIFRRTQEQVAESLNLSIRSLQRLQREATYVIARHLWTRFQAREQNPRSSPGDEVTPSMRSQAWSAQLKQELTLLQSQTADAECALNEIITGALRIIQASIQKDFQIDFPEDQFIATVKAQPRVLHQAFVNLLAEVTRIIPTGRIVFEAQPSQTQFFVMMKAAPFTGLSLPEFPLADGLLESQDSGLTVSQAGETLLLKIELQVARTEIQERILVVDDNTDLVYLYQSYCKGLPYQIFNLKGGKRIFEEIETIQPAVIILDILLPDVDGWDLLINLHTNSSTKSIPVIVCSVVTDEQLVHDLGAAMYLRKPIWRQQLLDALEQVSRR